MIYIWLAYFSLFLLGLTDNIRGPLFDEILKEFGLSHLSGSYLFSLSSVFGLIGSLVIPYFLRRKGEAHALRFSIVMMGISQLIVAFSSNYAAVLVAMAFLGFSIGAMGVCQNSLVIHHAPAEKLKKYQAGLHSVYGFASFIAPWLIALIYSAAPIWRNVFFVTAAANFLVLAMTFKAPKADPREKEEHDLQKTNRKEALVFSVMLGLYVAAEIMLSTRIPVFVIESWGVDLLTGGKWLSGFFVALLAGRLLMVVWHPKIRLKFQLLGWVGLSFLFLSLGLFTELRWALPLTGFAMGPIYPLTMTVAGDLFRGAIYRTTSYCFFSSSLLSMGMHTLFGAMTDRFGIHWAMIMGIFYLGITGLLILCHRRLFGRDYP